MPVVCRVQVPTEILFSHGNQPLVFYESKAQVKDSVGLNSISVRMNIHKSKFIQIFAHSHLPAFGRIVSEIGKLVPVWQKQINCHDYPVASHHAHTAICLQKVRVDFVDGQALVFAAFQCHSDQTVVRAIRLMMHCGV